MTTTSSIAFGPLEDRAAFEGAPSCDRISLRNLVRNVEIGAFQEERYVTQRLRFSAVVEVAAADAPLDDDVDRILSYDAIAEAIDASLAEERLALLETLAERIAAKILAQPMAQRVFLRIEKLDRGDFTLGVEIERAGGCTPAQPYTGNDPQPKIVCVPLGARADVLGRLARKPQPAPLLCIVEPVANWIPKAATEGAQRRVDLLEMDQAACVLASQNPNSIVVDSRTELRHVLGSGQVAIWAPSRIVLDAMDAPEAEPSVLAEWIAAELGGQVVSLTEFIRIDD